MKNVNSREIDTCRYFNEETGCNQSDCKCEKQKPKQETLEACGIETEIIFKGSELQYKHFRGLNWIDLDDDGKEYRLKPEHSKEIAELQRQIEILKNK